MQGIEKLLRIWKLGRTVRECAVIILKIDVNVHAITWDLCLTILERNLQQTPFVVITRSITPLMVAKHVLWLEKRAASELRELVKHVRHVISNEKVVIQLPVERSKIVLVTFGSKFT